LESYPYHGVVNMYDYKEVGKWDCWIEYNLTFTGGKMTNATLAMFRKTDNTERKKELEEFYKESNRISNLWYNKYFLKTKFILYIRKNLRDFLWYVADSLLTLSQKI